MNINRNIFFEKKVLPGGIEMINREPLYLIETSNEAIAKKFKATKGKSLFSGKTIWIGFMMNIDRNGVVTDTNGNFLFKLDNINKIESIGENHRIYANGHVYDFAL